MKSVSIIIPVIRPEKVDRCKKAAIENAGIDASRIEIVSEVDVDRIGAPKIVKRLVNKSTHGLVLFLGDDTIPQPNYLINALAAMETLPDGWGLVGLNDQFHDGNQLATHWLADKRLLEHLNNEFFHTGYIHCFCDNELIDRCRELDRYVWAQDAVIEHDHPLITGKDPDEGHRKAMDRENYNADWKLYCRRKIDRNVFKLGIGLPIGKRREPNNFWISLLNTDKPAESVLMVPRKEIYEFAGDIAILRNDLAQQALREGCSHLIMMDTDQVYPENTILQLLSHDVDVVGGVVHRRYPPFAPILYRGTLDKYQYVPDEEMYSGDMIEVDATGCACMLIKTEVFLDLDYPWFEIQRKPNGKTVGEDIGFCYKLRSKGKQIYVDTSVSVDHMSEVCVNRSMYELFKQSMGGQ